MDDIDPFVRARAICEAFGAISRRCLYDRVKRKDFPPPDRPAKRRGEPDLWRLSTVKRGLAEYAGYSEGAESRTSEPERAQEREG